MYDNYLDARGRLAPGQLVEIRYEDLVKDPGQTLEGVYRKLGLKNFDQVQPKIVELQNGRKGYEKNKFKPLDEAPKEQIRKRWAKYFEQFGY